MIRILFATAVGLFILSLPIHMTTLGSSLRRAAAFCFVLALIPALLAGLFFPDGFAAHPFAVVATGGGLVLLAYVVLHIRSAIGSAKPSRATRPMEKTPISQTRRREEDLFDFLADRQTPAEEE